MARRAPIVKLPPKTARLCWSEFWKRVLFVPLICIGGLAVIGGAMWLMGGQTLMWRTNNDMGTVLIYIACLLVLYPFLVIMWVSDLRTGLKAARDWQALPPEAQKAAIAEAKAARADLRAQRKARRARE